MGVFTVFCDGAQALMEKGHRKITPFWVPYSMTSMGSASLAIDLGFMSPNYSISTACATSNYSFNSAANRIHCGEADVMIAGATDAAILPVLLARFVAGSALSERNNDPHAASRPWDKDRDGFVMGEDAGILVNYVDARATSEVFRGITEVSAIKKVLKNTSGIKMNAAKSMIVQCLGAAGALEAITTLKAVIKGWLLPSANGVIPFQVL